MASAMQVPSAEVETSILAVLLSADTVREGATALLDTLRTRLDASSAALAVRDRDGLTLHVLAELGSSTAWPDRLQPQFAVRGQHGIDPKTSVMVIPLRADGRVVGALLHADVDRSMALLHDESFKSALEAVAAVLHVLVTRADAELRRHALALGSADAVLDGMAHQMSNPLTGASAIAQLLAEDLRDDAHRAAVDQIRQELARAFAVLSDILDFHRDTHAQDGVLDLNAVVERVLRFRGYAIREMGITLYAERLETEAPIRADGRALEYALLIAMRHAELQSHGTVNRSISVRVTERSPSEVAVDITDSGPGAVPDLAPGYFDLSLKRIQSVRAQANEKPDLGIVNSILRACGGRLEVTGSKTEGTTLRLVVPRAGTPNSSLQRIPA